MTQNEPTIAIDEATNRLVLYLPSVHAEGEGHHLRIPLTTDGLYLLFDTLKRRNQALARDRAEVKLASDAAPTQAMIEHVLKHIAAPKRKAEAKETFIKNLGIDISEEDLDTLMNLEID